MISISSVIKLTSIVDTTMETLKFIVFLFSAAIAYEFNDPLFNKFLTESLDGEYVNSYINPLITRHRREAPELGHEEKCHFYSQINCCGESSEMTISEEFKDTRAKCFVRIFGKNEESPKDPLSCEHMKAVKNKFLCLANCILEETGVIEDEDINKENLLTTIEKMYAMEDWKKDLIEPTADKCMSYAKTQAENSPKEDEQCSPLALKLVYCMWRTFQMDCPNDKYQQTPKCLFMREIMKKHALKLT